MSGRAITSPSRKAPTSPRSSPRRRLDKRIGNVAADPLMEYRAFWDIGTRDATAIWVAQFIGREIRVLDYYEAVGQPLAAHLGWLRSRGL
jgi:phage terminase large subunit